VERARADPGRAPRARGGCRPCARDARDLAAGVRAQRRGPRRQARAMDHDLAYARFYDLH
jgi:hypothetical protein